MSRHPAPTTVLVIEDAPNIVRLIEAALVGKPVRIETVRDGLEGLDRIRSLKPGLVLLDLALPSLHGFEILERVRASEETAHIPMVIISAQGDSETALRAKRLGADQFVAKPFLPNELRRAIDYHLDVSPNPTPKKGESPPL